MTDFFILAGGYGQRAEPLTSLLPKPLFPLNGKPLLSLLSEQIKAFGLKKGFINIHHLSTLIKEFPLTGLEIEYMEEKKLSGNRILSECRDRTKNDLLVLNGDTYLEIPLNTLAEKMQAEDIDGIITVREKDGIYSSILHEKNIFLKRDKDPGASDLMYAGVSIFRNSFLQKLTEENLFDSLEVSKGRIGVVKYSGIWLDLGTPENYFISDRTYRKFNNIPYGNSLSSCASISEESEVMNSIIWPNTKISGDVVISDSIITGELLEKKGVFRKKIFTEKGIFDLNI